MFLRWIYDSLLSVTCKNIVFKNIKQKKSDEYRLFVWISYNISDGAVSKKLAYFPNITK